MAPVVAATTSCTGRLPTGLNVLDMSDITQVFGHFNSSFTSQFHRYSTENPEISKNYSNILVEQQLLRLAHYCCLACFLLWLSYTQKTYLLFFYCYLSYYHC